MLKLVQKMCPHSYQPKFHFKLFSRETSCLHSLPRLTILDPSVLQLTFLLVLSTCQHQNNEIFRFIILYIFDNFLPILQFSVMEEFF